MKTLRDLQVGDKVTVRNCSSCQELIKHTTVKKITKTQITVEDGTRFLINGGIKFGQARKYRGWFTFIYAD